MQLNLKLEDSLYDKYLMKFGSPRHYQHMKRAIETFADIEFHDRILLLHGKERQAIEAVFETTLDDPEKLLRLLKNLNSVKINGVEVNFTPDEMARLTMQADFHGRPVEVYIEEMIRELKDAMLEKV